MSESPTKALRELDEKIIDPDLLAHIIESLPDALIVANSRGNIVLANNQAELMFGYIRPDLIGQPIEMLMPEAIHSKHVGHREGYMENPRVRSMGSHGMLLTARHKTGREFQVTINLSPQVTEKETLAIALIRRTNETRPQ